MREAILLIDPAEMVRRVYFLSAGEMGMAMLVAMHIAKSGPLPVSEIPKVAKLRGRKRWLAPYCEGKLFTRSGDTLDLCPDVFSIKHRGSDRLRSNLSPSIREAIHERDNYRCSYCGTGEGPFEIDHIHPLSRGGGDELDNLCLACAACNRSKSDKTLQEWGRAI